MRRMGTLRLKIGRGRENTPIMAPRRPRRGLPAPVETSRGAIWAAVSILGDASAGDGADDGPGAGRRDAARARPEERADGRPGGAADDLALSAPNDRSARAADEHGQRKSRDARRGDSPKRHVSVLSA